MLSHKQVEATELTTVIQGAYELQGAFNYILPLSQVPCAHHQNSLILGVTFAPTLLRRASYGGS